MQHRGSRIRLERQVPAAATLVVGRHPHEAVGPVLFQSGRQVLADRCWLVEHQSALL
jgi:hypothetical protein